MFLFTALSDDLIEESDDLLVYLMCFINSLDHLILRNLVGTGLDHDNFVSCGSYCQLKVRNILLSQCRVHNILSIDQADLCRCTWAIKWNIRNHVYQCYVVSVILREQRTHRSVDNTGGKDCVLACLSFSLIETARNLSYGVHFLFIFNA